jgi:hypothetical protein
MTKQEPELTSVHNALAEAALESKNAKPMVTATFRLPHELKDQAEQICGRHGTDLSSFLRQCCVGLVRDYYPNKG